MNFADFDRKQNKVADLYGQESQFGALLSDSPKNILNIRISRYCAYIFGRMFHIRVPLLVAILLCSSIPLGLCLLLQFANANLSGDTTAKALVLYYCVPCAMLFDGHFIWYRFVRMGDVLASHLVRVEDATSITSWFRNKLNLRKQVAYSCISGFVGVALIYAIEVSINNSIRFGIPSYVQAFMLSGLGFNAVYWLFAQGVTMYKIFWFSISSISWSVPSETPYLREKSKLLAYSIVVAVIGGFLMICPFIYFLSISDTLAIKVLSLGAFSVVYGTILFLLISSVFSLLVFASSLFW